jgi:hypothetical protein
LCLKITPQAKKFPTITALVIMNSVRIPFATAWY